ncbi:signal peptide peptidase SppA [Candidatus Woesearchaeota archaeon]|nr:signal peptide peptidase SppA [Candidatus Woesearchaeota archaeon]
MKKQPTAVEAIPPRPHRWGTALLVLFLLAFISFISSLVIGFFISGTPVALEGNVAHITIEGPILVSHAGTVFSAEVTESDQIIKLIQEADENPEIKAILFEINSPGGSAVASAEIASAIQKSNKITAAWIRESGASGAYWIASSTDYIVAHPLSITGSIGVIASYLDFAQFINRYNITYQRLVAGQYKDMGIPFRQLTQEEEKIFQGNLDAIHNYFILEVAKNRGISVEQTRKLANGLFYLGAQAKDMGLVDELGGKDEAVAYLERTLNTTVVLAKYEKPKTLAELLTEVISRQTFSVGEGIASGFVKQQARASDVTVRT